MDSPARNAALQISTNFARKLYLQRSLVWNFMVRDLKIRYVGSFMGFFWSIIHPLILLVSYTFVFSIVFDIRPRSGVTDNFAVFLFCGILPWLYFQDTILRSCTAVIENSNLIRKTLFPSEILPVSIALSNLVFHLIGVGVLMIVLIVLGLFPWTALFLPLFLLPLMVLGLGLGWLVASLQVFLRDTAQILTVALTFWFWFTPIFYTVDRVPEGLRPLMRLNPLSLVVQGYRDCLLEGVVPAVSPVSWLWLMAAGAFLVGGFVFRNTKREFVDVL